MPDNRHTNLPRAIVKRYRTHWRLFWCIMLPVAICAIALYIAQVIHLNRQLEEDVKTPSHTPSRRVGTTVSRIDTAYGIQSTIAPATNILTDTKFQTHTTWQLYPIPSMIVTDNAGITWRWELNKVGSFYYTPLFLLLIAFCPLSLAVARISSGSEGSAAMEAAPLTAREMWRQTGRKAFPVFVALILFMMIVDIGGRFFSLIFVVVPWLISSLESSLHSIANVLWPSAFLTVLLILILHYYFLVTLSLYNPCLILENNTLIGVFRRSHALVRGARWRFFKIYFLAGWITATIASVLMGIALVVFSVFIPELAAVREVLFPFQFLFLFIGVDITVALPEILSTPAMFVILVAKGLIATFLVPIWVILTTHLYLERVDAIKETESFNSAVGGGECH